MKSIGYLYFSLFLTCLICTSCEEVSTDSPIRENINTGKITSATGNTIYYNSFESEDDTSGWNGLSIEMFVQDPAPNAGKNSLLIGGGCPQPVGFKIINIAKEGVYSVNFWGKTGNLGGSVIFTIISEDKSYSREVQIDKQNWEKYRINNLFCLANSKIIIEIVAGGFVPADINLDEIKIVKKALTEAGFSAK